jgi:hypothetical protein
MRTAFGSLPTSVAGALVGLIEQLKYEGFTRARAEYGVQQAY